MTRYFLADFRSGDLLFDLDVMEGPYTDALNQPETLMVKIDMRNPDMIALNLRNTAARCKTVLGCAEGETIMALGPIWARNYDRDKAILTLNALGVWSYFDHRFILPLAAMSSPTGDFTNPSLDTNLAGMSLGTIAKRWVQQARTWTGGNIPVVFQDDELGPDRERNVTGIEFENLGDALEKLTQVEGGPDIDFQGRFRQDQLGIEWILRTGTQAEPMLHANTVHEWNLTAPESSVSNLHIDEDGDDMTSLAWATGGRSSDTALVSRAYDPALVNGGYPLLESMDASHSSVEKQATLDSYTAEAVAYGQFGSEIWSFDVDAHRQPIIGSFRKGDFCTLTVGEYDPETGEGDPYIPGGPYQQRIISVSGDHKGEKVSIQCAPRRSS